jgi:hypothetical protein
MALSRIDRLLAQLHGVVGDVRLVPIDDSRWGVYWTKAKRLADKVEALVPEQHRLVTTEKGYGKTRLRGARPSSLPHHYPNPTYT